MTETTEELLAIPEWLKRVRAPGERVPDFNRPLPTRKVVYAPARRAQAQQTAISVEDKAFLLDLGYKVREISKMSRGTASKIIADMTPPHIHFKNRR